MRLIDADKLDEAKFQPVRGDYITLRNDNVESYKMGWNDAIDAIMSEAETVEPERKTGKLLEKKVVEVVDLEKGQRLAVHTGEIINCKHRLPCGWCERFDLGCTWEKKEDQ